MAWFSRIMNWSIIATANQSMPVLWKLMGISIIFDLWEKLLRVNTLSTEKWPMAFWNEVPIPSVKIINWWRDPSLRRKKKKEAIQKKKEQADVCIRCCNSSDLHSNFALVCYRWQWFHWNRFCERRHPGYWRNRRTSELICVEICIGPYMAMLTNNLY